MERILCGDALEQLKDIESGSVDLCVTSPPYYQLRDYGVEGQIGLEDTVEEYIGRLVEVFEEVRRVLKDEGNLYINIGDSYAGSGKGFGETFENRSKHLQGSHSFWKDRQLKPTVSEVKPKNLIGIPWKLAFALQARGWYLREDIIWAKPNPMPESVTDRCTRSHEYIFHLTKQPHYYYDEAVQGSAFCDIPSRPHRAVHIGRKATGGGSTRPLRGKRDGRSGRRAERERLYSHRTKFRVYRDHQKTPHVGANKILGRKIYVQSSNSKRRI